MKKNSIIENDPIYLVYLHLIFGKIFWKKLKVAMYIFENRAKENNILVPTIKELSKKLHVSNQTVLTTLQILEKENLIFRKTGSIRFNIKLLEDYSDQIDSLEVI
jgi:DNA-binding MarR family transcriptional regulator